MKFSQSIKWRLQLWYGLILVAVLAGFGFTAYQLERGRQFRQVDDELHRRISVLADAMHGPPGARGPRGGQPFNRPPRDPFNDEGPPPEMPGQRPQMPRQFRLSEQAARLFETNDVRQFYFSILGRDGTELARSDFLPPKPTAEVKAGRENLAVVNPPAPNLEPRRQRKSVSYIDGYRELLEQTPSGETVRVGCSIATVLQELRRAKLNLLAVGGGILFVGLIGGWWFVSRALRPISQISATATKISAGDLSQRINVAETESELGQLAAVLNSTFARLETAFAQQKQFASDAAHELRTPVTVILTQTQMALNRERDAAGYKQTVEACQRAAQRMRKLIESLLELARFDAGQEVLKRMPFDLAATVGDAVELVQTLAAEKSVTVFSDLEPMPITGDSERIAQVVTNLLTNAIQYNQPDGEVRVKLVAEGGLAVLTVADTGRGIAAEDLPRVFERFYRGDKSRTGAGNSGLGLSICKAIVEAHGGTIEAAGELGAGTKFTVRLPI